jgi:ATP-binding cassette subfamily B multidrug efflux pump
VTRADAALVWRWFVAAWRDRAGWLIALILLSCANAVVVTTFPWLWKGLVDAMEGTSPDATSIGRIGAWLLVVGVGQSALYVVLQGSRTLLNSRIQRATRTRVFDRLTRQDDAFYARWRTGDLVTRLTDDAGEKTAWFLCSGVFRALEAALIVVTCLGAMTWQDAGLTAWVVLPLPVLLVAQALLQGVLARRYAAVQASISSVNDELASTFGAIRVVQAAGLAPAARRRFVAAAEHQRGAEIAVARVNQAIFLMYGHGWQLAVGLLLLVGGPRVVSGEISLGQFVAFEGLVMAMVWPMFDVGMFVSRFMQAGVALGRLESVLAEALPPAGGRRVDFASDGLELAGVSLRGVDGTLILDVIDLVLSAGELVAVVGEVGSGKSSLLRVLAGASPPTMGSVALGGVPIVEADPTAVRRRIAFVPQDPVLLSLSLGDNIGLGRPSVAGELDRAVRIARLAQDLPQLPDGLDTIVGERGVTLSGGQQQRAALARALVGRPHVLLLDDATAALDADTEAAFWAELEGVLPDVTAVVVTHRPATIARADRVVVLDAGRVAQVGRHADLIEQDGPYRRIYGRLDDLERQGGVPDTS